MTSLAVATLAAAASLAAAGANDFHLTATPGRGGGSCAPGEHQLALGGGRHAFLRVNAGGGGSPRPLLLVLHGAGSGARGGLYAFRGGWRTPGLVLLAPVARGTTWSALRGTDVDLETVDRSLRRAFARCRVDPRRIGVGGFSDGATYALTLGLANGRLFRSVIALSPGGVLGDDFVGRPRVFVAHGRQDGVFSIADTSDVLVPDLRGRGYRVTYVRFRGGHEVVDAISARAVRWFVTR